MNYYYARVDWCMEGKTISWASTRPGDMVLAELRPPMADETSAWSLGFFN